MGDYAGDRLPDSGYFLLIRRLAAQPRSEPTASKIPYYWGIVVFNSDYLHNKKKRGGMAFQPTQPAKASHGEVLSVVIYLSDSVVHKIKSGEHMIR